MDTSAPETGKKHLWNLDSTFTFLNHGSFGAMPKAIIEKQHELRLEIESQPVRHFQRQLDGLLDSSRKRLAGLVGADPEGLVFVPNATTGVNTVLRTLDLSPGDEILVTDHIYNACNNAALLCARQSGAKAVTAHIPFPVESSRQVKDLILERVTERTRFVLVDHITSPTALIFPVEELVAELDSQGIDVMVDGAHAPGMVPLDLGAMGVPYYTGNCHKWLCAPKGSAFLYIREDKRKRVRPLVISHGANSVRTDKSFLHLEFDWTGTDDYTPYILVGDCIDYLDSLYPGGLREHMRRNHELALAGKNLLCEAFDSPPPCPDAMLGSMAAPPILPLVEPEKSPTGKNLDQVQEILYRDYRIEVPVINWPAAGMRLVRISAQAYNTLRDYEVLAAALKEITSNREH
jgi:isopenicillin-N epimerase